MPAVGLHRLPADDPLPLLPHLRRDGLKVRVPASRAQRFADGHRAPLEPQRLLFPERQSTAGEQELIVVRSKCHESSLTFCYF